MPENLLNYEETPGASEAINKWVDQGHEVFIITGRPFNSYEPSRKWLDEHHLERVPLFCVDKYGRETAKQDYKYNMTLEELYNMTFDFAVEDSPAAFEHVIHFDNCRTAVFDRPWNSRAELPNDRFVRCKDWQEIDRVFEIEKRRMTYDKFLKAAPVVFLIGTMVTAILYQKTLLEIWLTIAITFGTTAYHFIMRWVVAFIYNSIMHNRADYRKHWYQVSKSEMKLYEKLRVKKWKNRMPTYNPSLFDPRQHTWEEIAQVTCQAELGHETIVVLSFVPILAGHWLGGYPAFIITSILAAMFDMMFVIMQRYNRQRILKLIK